MIYIYIYIITSLETLENSSKFWCCEGLEHKAGVLPWFATSRTVGKANDTLPGTENMLGWTDTAWYTEKCPCLEKNTYKLKSMITKKHVKKGFNVRGNLFPPPLYWNEERNRAHQDSMANNPSTNTFTVGYWSSFFNGMPEISKITVWLPHFLINSNIGKINCWYKIWGRKQNACQECQITRNSYDMHK